jgi:hypothetical protein
VRLPATRSDRHHLSVPTIGELQPSDDDRLSCRRRRPGRRSRQAGATAKVHGWTLVTRNTKDFAHMNIPLLNPFSEEVE